MTKQKGTQAQKPAKAAVEPKKEDEIKPATVPPPPAAPEATEPRKFEKLELDRGTLIAFRTSGGAPFTMREIVVYPDGRVSFGGPDMGKNAYKLVPRKMNDAQMMHLRHLLDQVGFFRLQSSEGEPPPASFKYEIAARLGSRLNTIQVFEGNVPEVLKPLLEQLNTLMPKE
jgi:hypothetical protein